MPHYFELTIRRLRCGQSYRRYVVKVEISIEVLITKFQITDWNFATSGIKYRHECTMTNSDPIEGLGCDHVFCYRTLGFLCCYTPRDTHITETRERQGSLQDLYKALITQYKLLTSEWTAVHLRVSISSVTSFITWSSFQRYTIFYNKYPKHKNRIHI